MNNEILINGSHELFSRKDMDYAVFASDYLQIRYYTLLLIQRSRPKSDERLLLEQQVSEIIKNAVKHGNDCDLNKKVRVWYSFSSTHAHLIVEDEGSGFKDLEKWNDFNRKRLECLYQQDFEHLGSYVSFRTNKSDEQDGGNALFAALEYWNGGFVYNEKRNGVAMLKKYPQRRHGISIDGE